MAINFQPYRSRFFETTEDYEKKDKIIVMTGQLLRVLARFVACGDDSCVPLVASDHRSSGRYKLEK